MNIFNYDDPFSFDDLKKYQRKVDPIKDYFEDSAYFLSKSNSITIEEATSFLKTIPNLITNPLIEQTRKDENNDSILVNSTLYEYLYGALKEGELISPTMTTYYPESKLKSYLVDFTIENKKKRSKAKKEMFAFKVKGDLVQADIKNTEQQNQKIYNNAISGLSRVSNTPIYNPTMHSTLTSTCRMTSAYANSNNERLLGGNRHYFKVEIVLNNIVSICNHTDYEKLSLLVTKYNLHIPSVDEVFKAILRSSRQYFRDKRKEESIYNFLTKLDPLELTAFLYTSSLYDIKEYNDSLVREIVTSLSKKVSIDTPLENQVEIINQAKEEIYNLAIQIYSEEAKGYDTSSLEFKSSHAGLLLAHQVLFLYSSIEKYRDFFEVFFRHDNMPFAISYFESSIRHVVIMSDTDSTIFTTEDWVKWYFGENGFEAKHNAVFAALVFISLSTLKHILAVMSINLGISHERINEIAMKNEYKFEVFVPTLNTKHYYSLITYREGQVFKEPELEIKGVHLKSSNAPPFINELSNKLMSFILTEISLNKKISILKILKEIADTERVIIKSINDGKTDYYKSLTMKNKDSYKNSELESNYKHHLFWNATFGKYYGEVPDPPYAAVKINTTTTNQTLFKEWLTSMENTALAKDIEEFLTNLKANHLSTFYIPLEPFLNHPIPKEIISIVDIRKMLVDIMKTLYIIMETHGIFILNPKYTRLFSDEY